jgi:hypothetical protein
LRVKENVLRMKKSLLLCSLAILVIFVLSCGHPMSLQSITVSPATSTVTGYGLTPPVGAQAQYVAYGHFINPVKMVDISSQVTWSSLFTDVATVSNSPQADPGMVTAGVSCGTTIITATAGKGVIGPGDANEILTGTGTFIVSAPNAPSCGGLTPSLAVIFGGTGSGTVTGSGFNCTSTGGVTSGICALSFASGTAVALVATPATGSSFGAWSGCTTTNSQTCQVSLTSSAVVTATFN